MVILVAIIVEHFSRIIARIKRLQFDVNAVAEGRMDHEIVATGYDEITKLSYDIDNMRSAMLRNVEKEREALQMNTELITSMSHDIRTPLTVLMGYVDIMKSGLPPEEMEEYILASEKTVQRLKSLSDDMFKYFRAFGRGGEDITMEEYDAPTLFEQLLSEHVLLLSESGYRVNYNIDELLSERLIVRTDAPHLMRIVDNIFSNPYKYASIDEEVSIIGRRVDDLAVFEFKNVATRNAGAESSKVGLKTCKRLSEYILNSFEYGEEDGIFTLTFSLKLYEEGTKISESFVIR
jgi:signal transduction histidine kinase